MSRIFGFDLLSRRLEEEAFAYIASLMAVFFKGNVPIPDRLQFFPSNNATVYYLPGTSGWGSTFGGLPAVLWNPSIQTTNSSFGVWTNQFGFNITGTTSIPVVVEASTNLTVAFWTALQSCTLTNRCRSPELSRVCSRNLSQPGGGWLSSDEQVRVRRLFRMKGLAPVHAHEHLLGKEKELFANGPV
jgi:hypothetical protein